MHVNLPVFQIYRYAVCPMLITFNMPNMQVPKYVSPHTFVFFQVPGIKK